MSTLPHSAWLLKRLTLVVLLAFAGITPRTSFSQNLVLNGDFNATTANWNFFAPATISECTYFETTYGGTDAANHVAEIDYGSNLRQTNIAVTPGKTYVLSLRHSRRDVASNPNNINVNIYNGATTFLSQDITSANATWSWQCASFTFTPTTSTINLDIKNVTPGNTQTLGTIVDDITITPQQQVITSSGEVCPGGTVTLSAPASVAGATYTNYSWTGPGGFTATGSTATITNVQAAQAGTYTCTMTLNGCAAVSGTFELALLPKPDVTLVSAADIYICPGGSAGISLANINNTNTNQWFKDNTVITGATNSTLDVDASGDYKVVVTSSGGCVDTSQTVHVFYNAMNINFTFDIYKACLNDTVVFHNQSDTGHYTWNFGDMSPEDTAANPVHIYQNQGSYIVKLKAASSKGCVDSVMKTVDINHPLHAAFTQSADTICLGSGVPVTFTDASTGDISDWNWTFGEGLPSTAQNAAYIFTQAGSHTIRLVVKENNLPCYDTAYGVVQVDSTPYFSISQDKYAICTGEAVHFDAAYYASTIRSIAWNFGDGTQWNQIGASVHHYESPGVYWIMANADFGACGISYDIDSVVVHPSPFLSLGPDADTALCLDGNPISAPLVFSDPQPGIGEALTFLWNTGATTPVISIVHPGIYTVTATKNGCAATATIEVNKDCYTDIPNVFTPNGDGVNDYFYPRQLLSKGVVGFTMTVFNRWGQNVFETANANGRGWDGRFNDKEQPMGVYIYQISVVFKNARTENYTGNVTLMR